MVPWYNSIDIFSCFSSHVRVCDWLIELWQSPLFFSKHFSERTRFTEQSSHMLTALTCSMFSLKCHQHKLKRTCSQMENVTEVFQIFEISEMSQLLRQPYLDLRDMETVCASNDLVRVSSKEAAFLLLCWVCYLQTPSLFYNPCSKNTFLMNLLPKWVTVATSKHNILG